MNAEGHTKCNKPHMSGVPGQNVTEQHINATLAKRQKNEFFNGHVFWLTSKILAQRKVNFISRNIGYCIITVCYCIITLL